MNKNNFTLTELILVIGIIAILNGMLLSAIGVARSKAKLAGCVNNLKQIGIATTMYADDNNGRIMPVLQFKYACASSYYMKHNDGIPSGLGYLIDSKYNIAAKMLGCSWHNPRTPETVESDWSAGLNSKEFGGYYCGSAYIYRETLYFNEILSSPLNSGKAMVMDHSADDMDKFNMPDEIAHGNKNINILFNDGHVRNALNEGNFTYEGDIISLWNNADKL